MNVHLYMAVMIRTVEPVHHEWHPSGAAFEKADAQFGKAIEYSMADHRRCLNHQAERMAQGMHRIVSRERIHAHVMQRADVDG